MIYNANYFIKKFEAIPEELWTTGDFIKDGCKCALGHCGLNWDKDTEEGTALLRLLKYRTPDINDAESDDYPQPTPKQRILAALNDVKNETF